MNHTRTRIFTAGTALAIAALGVAGVEHGADAASARHHRTVMTFVVQDEDGNFALADNGPPSQAGEQDITDIVAMTQTLTQDGAAVGRVSMEGIGVDHDRGVSQVVGTLRLDGGDVEFSGLVPKRPHFTLAVVGGTRDYVGAVGTLTLDFRTQDQLLVLRLRNR